MQKDPSIKLHSMPLPDFVNLFPRRWSEGAIRKKIQRGHWAYGQEYVKDPDGKIHILLDGYAQWVESAAPPTILA
ncbi:MAG: hypothetical protein EVA65_00955 [Oceanococcus sp.]|nr:MAG: hypothetical protein EVA65_00955 [Oceanococcus sp.]